MNNPFLNLNDVSFRTGKNKTAWGMIILKYTNGLNIVLKACRGADWEQVSAAEPTTCFFYS